MPLLQIFHDAAIVSHYARRYADTPRHYFFHYFHYFASIEGHEAITPRHIVLLARDMWRALAIFSACRYACC
jgi:hypothetical protein